MATDPISITDGIALFKSGMDGIRGVFGVWKDVRGSLPEGAKRDEVTRALELSEQRLQIAEAQIAKGFGYALCKCEFPPTPMLTVRWIERGGGRAALRCPKCGLTDNGGPEWTTTEEITNRGQMGVGTRETIMRR
jgi:hypothetical protein